MPTTNDPKKPSKSKQTMTGAEVLLHTLEKNGVELMLGYTGGAIMPTFDTLKKFPNIKFIATRHEQGAGFIAQGYTRASGKLAPVLVTSGPGAANLITAIADAKMDSVPMLSITGQVSTKVIGTDAFQESDIVGMAYACSKYAYMPLTAHEVAQTTSELIYIATHGRPGPVVLDLPKDVQISETENIDFDQKLNLPGFELPPKADLKDILEAVEILKSAKKPLALVGHGVILSESGNELKNFLEKAQIPAAFTLHGLSSLPANNPLNLGMLGMHGEIEANKAVIEADVLIALGMRFDDRVTGKVSEFAKGKKVIHIEIDPSEIHKTIFADCTIYADLKEALKLLTENCPTVKPEARTSYFAEIEANRKKSKEFYKHIFEAGIGKKGKLHMARVVHELSEFTGGKDNVISDVGQHQMFAAKFYKYQRFNSWFSSGGAGTMGFGLPAAIGVKLARPDEEVWSINGDGGFQMNIQELGTILQEKLNVNILILNNSFLGMVRQWQDLFYDKNFAQTELINPDFGKIAEAYGISYRKVEKVEDIKAALEWSKLEQKATIVEFICDSSEHVFPMIPSGASYSEMIEDEEDARAKLG
jgi:acetolactate synthase-1/2/3 large subunit